MKGLCPTKALGVSLRILSYSENQKSANALFSTCLPLVQSRRLSFQVLGRRADFLPIFKTNLSSAKEKQRKRGVPDMRVSARIGASLLTPPRSWQTRGVNRLNGGKHA